MKNRQGRNRRFRKSTAALLAALILLCGFCGAGSARAGNEEWLPELPWDDGREAYLNDPYVKYIRPQCGPGSDYKTFISKNGSKQLYDPDEMTRADICFSTGDWLYVGFGYSDKAWRFGFFHKSVFSLYDSKAYVPEYLLDYEVPGTMTGKVVPRNGPGWEYPDYPSCSLSRGDAVYACMQSNDWYLCRFWNGHGNKYGYVYLWVPGSLISFR